MLCVGLVFLALFSQRVFSANVVIRGGLTIYGDLALICYKRTFFKPLVRAYWRRNATVVGYTGLFWSNVFDEELEKGSKTSTGWRHHILLIKRSLDVNLASEWSCSDTPESGFATPISFGTSETTETRVIPMPKIGNLTLQIYPRAPVEDSPVTLSCSADVNSTLGYWEVMWIRNMHLLVYTSSNSTVIGQQNITVANETISLEIVSVQADEFGQNVTFLAKGQILDNSTWSCRSQSVSEGSNNVTVLSVLTDSLTRPNQIDELSSVYLLYIGAAGCGVVLLLVVLAVVLVIKKRQKYQENIWTSKSSGYQPERNDSLVTKENILYETSTEDFLCSPQPQHQFSNEVMMDNILYSSSSMEESKESKRADTYLI